MLIEKDKWECVSDPSKTARSSFWTILMRQPLCAVFISFIFRQLRYLDFFHKTRGAFDDVSVRKRDDALRAVIGEGALRCHG